MGAGLAALLLAILDQTIVASAAAPIVRDLHPAGGVGQIPWLIAAYTLASTCVQPLYGKLADRFGPRRDLPDHARPVPRPARPCAPRRTRSAS